MRERRKIRVKAVEGRRVMLHDSPSRAIAGEREVLDHPHYRRAIARGDLELVTTAAPKAKPKKEG